MSDQATDPVVVDYPEAHRFELRLGDEVAGFAEYQRTAAATSFTHTEVGEEYGGRGYGSLLAKGALDATQAAGRAALPFCPFIRAYIVRHPEYLVLVPEGRRAQFGL